MVDLFFIFGDYDTKKSQNVIVTELPPLIIQYEEYDYEEIEGRDGYLSNNLGNRKAIIKEIEIKTIKDEAIKELRRNLKGSNWLRLSNDIEHVYQAKLNSITEGEGEYPHFRTYKLKFYCQPNGYDISTMYFKKLDYTESLDIGERRYKAEFKKLDYYKGYPVIRFIANTTEFEIMIRNKWINANIADIAETSILRIEDIRIGSVVELDTELLNIKVDESYPEWSGEITEFKGDNIELTLNAKSGTLSNIEIMERWAI